MTIISTSVLVSSIYGATLPLWLLQRHNTPPIKCIVSGIILSNMFVIIICPQIIFYLLLIYFVICVFLSYFILLL